MNRCLTPELIERWDTTDMRGHLDSCPRCHSLANSYRSFVAAQPIPGANLDDAERRLAIFLSTMPEATHTAAAPRPPVGRVRAFRSPTWIAAAAAVLLLAFLLPRLNSREDVGVLRDGTPATLQLLSPLPPAGDRSQWLLRWDFLESADHYELRLYSTDLNELIRYSPLQEPQFLLDPPAHEGALLWRIYAYRAGEIVASSAVGTLAAH